ncbi:SDR family oxidoreductase [Vibrio natriegens]|uniref:NAD-dependent dehydratase n=1 Tax=Vibrio natriegens NBRC 15636 = ATCC 14048 = DSM 759 TaxID=1219067 RepID=A0AAN0Y7X9_VIBNA|nr:SDR family oxidoreductase [Vibrio natriegens]ALR17908.1 NAD-dependent dehydratase [Vibrio natriegens NBRC 15636 = ATCC 14048 = DSM 759]ANQ15401.1 NAD-dependent dehydratase [Vibrio natriegens NBRC 15636 = ATCC 14048 = DSM 759]EPM41108.1 NAD-dependent dehydratase [Vibrio natriegens NBRC 15636 = ATCC 14048 = DSM 759]MDX6029243.1 SDR family oxidoreductase [Vibrio natriegens NBRC 15636 = ATCC 14048 = DSM 759]UUI14050.1 SDR family oxidoreductase [Vibrio natriegens]
MSNVLVLGASGQIAQWVVKFLTNQPEINQTLFLRNPKKLAEFDPAQAQIVVGNVLDRELLKSSMSGQDIVYANLIGDDLDKQAEAVIDAMQETGVKRLIFVLSLGIYDEIPGKFGEWNDNIIGEPLKYYRRAADAIEASGLDYTILRPAWLMDDDEVDYEITEKGQPFKGTVVSRKSVGDLIAKVIVNPDLHIGANLGVNKPNTDADKPYFM